MKLDMHCHVKEGSIDSKETSPAPAAIMSCVFDPVPVNARTADPAKDAVIKNTPILYRKKKDIIASVKKAWTKSGGKVGDIKSVDLYIKPEESAVYYVINKTETGSVAF